MYIKLYSKVDRLKGKTSTLDVATNENLEKLVKLGEHLLENPVSRLDLDTGLVQPIENGGTNKEALKRFINFLSLYSRNILLWYINIYTHTHTYTLYKKTPLIFLA